jgi:hypothetical protein
VGKVKTFKYMDEETFWNYISASRSARRTGLSDISNHKAQLETLRKLLELLTNEELIGFQRIYCILSSRAERWDLLRAAMLIEGGVGDDGFLDFKAWLISCGKDLYSNAIQNPDSLAECASVKNSATHFFPLFSSVAPSIYEERTHEEMPDAEFPIPPEIPAGEQFPFAPAELERKFPRLWALFKHNCP